MNWDRIEGNWKQLKGSVLQQWGKITEDQLDVIAGRRDVLLGRIQEAYGVSREEGEKQRCLEALRSRYSWLGGFGQAVVRGDVNALIEHCKTFNPEQVDTLLSMRTDASKDASAVGYFREGFSFSPMYTIGMKKTVKAKGELRTWLKVAKAS